MSCSKCKDGFVTSALLGRIACLACRDARIDGEPRPAAAIDVEAQSGSTENPLGQQNFERLYIDKNSFAVWIVDCCVARSHFLPRGGDTYELLFGRADNIAVNDFRSWFFMEDKIGGYHTSIDVSSEFGPGAIASIDKDWNVRLELQCSTVASFRLTDNSPNGRRFRRAIKLPEPRVYT